MFLRRLGPVLVLTLALVASLTMAAPVVRAQTATGAADQVTVDRGLSAINYQYLRGSTKVSFTGVEPGATGEASVETKRGYVEIKATFRGLPSSRTFGSEYFSYVLWAITPQGRAQNLGELVIRGSQASMKVTTELQAFALIVTAEPYFAITQPSDAIVLENAVRADTRGRVEQVQARAELIPRGAFLVGEAPDELTARLMIIDQRTPLELYQARNAVRLVRWLGAEQHAAPTFDKAVKLLIEAENYQARKSPATKAATMMARQAVQAAEDARLITMRSMVEQRQANERASAASREAEAVTLAASEANRRLDAESGLKAAQEATVLAERLRAEAEAAQTTARAAQVNAEATAAQAERVRAEAERATQQAQGDRAAADVARQSALADLERTRTESQALQARGAAETAAAEQARATAAAELERIARQSAAEVAALDTARREALRLQQSAEADAAQARTAADTSNQLREQAERERAQLRTRLQEQLNRVLETTNTARGLIVNMSDVLFDTGQSTLRDGAREKLARISGILSTQIGLRLEIEGHTDSVGSHEYNQQLSEQRARSVSAYLVGQGIDSATIAASGFGETMPKVDNDSAASRQQNRRVDLVVSGAAIDPQVSSTATTPSALRAVN